MHQTTKFKLNGQFCFSRHPWGPWGRLSSGVIWNETKISWSGHCNLHISVITYDLLSVGVECRFRVAVAYTAIPYRASTGAEQGFPCEVFHTGKNLLSLQGTPVLIAGTPVFTTGISLWENFTGKTLFSLQGMGLQFRLYRIAEPLFHNSRLYQLKNSRLCQLKSKEKKKLLKLL